MAGSRADRRLVKDRVVGKYMYSKGALKFLNVLSFQRERRCMFLVSVASILISASSLEIQQSKRWQQRAASVGQDQSNRSALGRKALIPNWDENE